MSDFIDLAVHVILHRTCQLWIKRSLKKLRKMRKMTFHNAYVLGQIETELVNWKKELNDDECYEFNYHCRAKPKTNSQILSEVESQ